MKTLKKISLMLCLLLYNIVTLSAQVTNPPTVTDTNYTKDIVPFRIAGNLYYVGTYDLSSYLITTPKGHILINTGLSSSTDMIRRHVEALGFKFADIKILLTSQVHYDHVAAMAEIEKLTNAQVMVNEKDAQVLADGGNSDYLYGGNGSLFEPVQPDRLLHDHDTIKLGGMKIVALHHPGHTKGSTSYLFDVKDKQHTYTVLIANMPSIIVEGQLKSLHTYPGIVKDYAYTLNAMKKLHFDLWLAAHASQCDLHKKHKPGDGYNPEAFRDQTGYNAAIAGYEKAYRNKLNRTK